MSAVLDSISAKQVATEAYSLAKQWPTFEPQAKRNIIEALVEKITIGKGESDISFLLPAFL